jgi:hypothetical protein
MVVISVTGGLGNQMFYYALYRYLQMQGIDVWLDVNWYSGTNYNGFPIPYIAGEVEHCKYKLEDYFHLPKIRKTEIETSIKIAKKRLEVQINCESSSSSYIKKAKENKDIFLTGFYRNWDFCYEIRNILIDDFVFSMPPSENIQVFLNEIEISNSVSIHVRRSDFFRTELHAIHNGSICNMNYYRNSINYFTG